MRLGAKEDAELVYRLHSLRRGLFRVGPAVVEASGPFGLVRRFLVDRDVRFLTVLPKSVGLGGGWPLGHRPIHEVPRRRSLFEDPTRFIGTRDYRPGDPLRRVHWRATARSRTIQVKLYEPAVLEGALVAVEMDAEAYPGLDLEAEAGDPLVELTVTAAAAVVEFVLAGDQRAGLLANGSDAAERYGNWTGGSFRRLDEALEEAAVHRRAAVFRPLEVAPAQGAPARAAADGVGAADAGAQPAVVRAARRRAAAAAAVVGADGGHAAARRRAGRRAPVAALGHRVRLGVDRCRAGARGRGPARRHPDLSGGRRRRPRAPGRTRAVTTPSVSPGAETCTVHSETAAEFQCGSVSAACALSPPCNPSRIRTASR